MTLKLELAPAVESGLLAQARKRGLSLEEYAEKVLEAQRGKPETSQKKEKPA